MYSDCFVEGDERRQGSDGGLSSLSSSLLSLSHLTFLPPFLDQTIQATISEGTNLTHAVSHRRARRLLQMSTS